MKQSKAIMNREFFECIRDIIYHPVVLQMKQFSQHCDTDCYQHCLMVAYYNFSICKSLGLDARSAARGGMLHDLFLYDWRKHREKTGDHFHAMTHPWTAYRNAKKYFSINTVEKEIITKHMWPVTFIPPRHPETYVICLTDKYCGTLEIAEYYSGRWSSSRIGRPLAKMMQKLSENRPRPQEIVPELLVMEAAGERKRRFS
ncbi:HDIG domain-containing metalloprotein [Ruminococcus gauvreauii]|uniref:HDIG domain-containing protein n=1 Tax=Ruminococcus gauvreauii TaxID=438033 RepID=A0ABY5VJD4_9FIRM|nr:HDIG domain-containing metalloprotein [Ruminococcus gauvreauii]UWP60412.1 HDIG domain-containing protein [Ruminococcus gauvreauii]